nr:MAG TPA: hypothetical protein [Bacteriophage sp.]
MKSEKKFVIRMLILVAVGLMFFGYGKYVTTKVRNEVINSVTLVESNEDYYTISFDGEEHIYDYEEE